MAAMKSINAMAEMQPISVIFKINDESYQLNVGVQKININK
jgi:hypothetical protein